MLTNIFNSKSVKEFYRLIDSSDKIVLTCHVRPDGDAIGSTLGMYHLLQTLGKDAKVVTPDVAPRTLSFLPSFKEIIAHSRYNEFATKLIEDADLLICCDFNKPNRQDELEPIVSAAKCKKVLIDHHQQPDNFVDLMFSYPEMSSASELVFRLIAAMGLLDYMDKKSATCIGTGIITDTRNLSVNSSNYELYLIMVELLKKGIDKQLIIKESLETKTFDSIKLHAYAIAEKMEIFEQHQAAIITLDCEELKKFNYERGDSEGLVNEPLQIRGITYSFFLREDSDCIKISARSVNQFPVSKICEDLFNGGGHLQASGGEFKGSIYDCKKLLINSLPKYDKYLRKQKTKITTDENS